MKKPSQSLYRLIKSLTKAEKRNFVLYASKYGGSKIYLRLFNEISKQKQYDEEAIKARYKSEKFTSYFYSVKEYLFNMILESLKGRKVDLKPIEEVNIMIDNARVLLGKNLIAESYKHLQKAKLKAERLEADTQLLEIMRLEDEAESLSGRSYNNAELKKVEQRKLSIKRLNSTIEMENLLREYETLKMSYGNIRKEEHYKNLLKFLSKAVSKKNITGIRAEFIYLHLLSEYNFLQGKDDAGVEIMKKQNKLLNDNRLFFSRYLYDFGISKVYFMSKYEHTGYYDEALEVIKELKAFTDMPSTLIPTTSIYISIFSVIIATHKNNKASMKKLLLELEENYSRYSGVLRTTDKIDTVFVMAWIYFLLGDYEGSLKWINFLLAEKEIAIRSNIYSVTRILNIMVHYELAAYDTVHYILRNTRYYLNKKSSMYKFEAIFLEMFAKLIKAGSRNEKSEIVGMYKNKLAQVGQSRFERPMSGSHFPLLLRWFDKKFTY